MYRLLLLFICLINTSLLFGHPVNDNDSGCAHLIGLAKEELQNENYTKLKRSLLSLSEKLGSLSHDCKVDYLLLQGKYQFNEGDFDFAITYFEDAKKLCLENSFSDRYIESTYFLALANIDRSEKEFAAKLLDDIIFSKANLENSEFINEIFETRAMLYSLRGEHEKAMQCLKSSIKFLGAGENNLAIRTQILNQIATNYQTLGQVDSSIFYFKKLISLKEEAKDAQGILSDYSTLGGLYKEIGSYENAQKYYMDAMKQSQEIQDSLSLLSAYVDIANVYLEQRLVSPAFAYAEKAEQLSKQKHILFVEGQSYQLKGAILEIDNQKDMALELYTKALNVFQKLELKENIADLHLSIAELFGDKDNLYKAESALRKALQIRLESKDKTGELNSKLALCNVLIKLNKSEKEIKRWLMDAFVIAQETNNKTACQEAYYLQSQLDERLGNYRSALTNFKKHYKVRDSILNQENATIVRELEERYLTAEKNKEIALQQKQISVQELALKKRNTQITQLLSGLLIFMILSFLIFITYQRNKMFNKQKLSVIEKEKEAQILRAMVSGEEQERRRIARDLHDGLGANLATVKMRIDALRNNIPGIEKLESYNKAEELIDDACANVRKISHNMMPGSLSRHGLEVALQDICDAIQAANQLEVTFIPFGLDNIIDEVVEINIFRIIQELLKNIIKHAEAKEVIVQLSVEDDRLHMVVEDDGRGFDASNISVFEGIGMRSIQSRVTYLNGNINIDSSLGHGSTFNIEIPLKTIKN